MPCCESDASVEEYVRSYIIGYFGYAYVNDLLLGGIAQQRTIITESDRTNLQKNGWSDMNEAGLRVAATQIFSAEIKVKATQTYDQEKLEKFSRYTKQGRVTTLGGDISLQSFEDWSKTVKSNPTIIKFGISWIFDLLNNQRFPNDPNITMKARLIQTAIEKYVQNPIYCYNQCTHPSQGTCVDSGYFRFGTCQCQNGWEGLDCSKETDHEGKEICWKKNNETICLPKYSCRKQNTRSKGLTLDFLLTGIILQRSYSNHCFWESLEMLKLFHLKYKSQNIKSIWDVWICAAYVFSPSPSPSCFYIVRAQTETHGSCMIWGGFHLVGFPVHPQQADLRSSYRCRTANRILIVKNAFIELYANVTDNPYGTDYVRAKQ